MKKLAIIFFGIAYNEAYDLRKTRIDFRESVENYQTYIFDFFTELGYEIDVFIATNIINSKIIYKSLVNTYKPKKIVQCSNIGDHLNSRSIKIRTGICACIEYCRENNITYDHCLITRFDLLFLKPFTTENINFDKINVVSQLEKKHYICDNLYILPYIYLERFLKILKTKNFHHDLIKEITSITDINYICNENKYISSLSFYKIVRNTIRLELGNIKNNGLILKKFNKK